MCIRDRHYIGGVRELAKEFEPVRGKNIVIEAKAKLAGKFASENHIQEHYPGHAEPGDHRDQGHLLLKGGGYRGVHAQQLRGDGKTQRPGAHYNALHFHGTVLFYYLLLLILRSQILSEESAERSQNLIVYWKLSGLLQNNLKIGYGATAPFSCIKMEKRTPKSPSSVV